MSKPKPEAPALYPNPHHEHLPLNRTMKRTRTGAHEGHSEKLSSKGLQLKSSTADAGSATQFRCLSTSGLVMYPWSSK